LSLLGFFSLSSLDLMDSLSIKPYYRIGMFYNSIFIDFF
jgi:hypothetical protein